MKAGRNEAEVVVVGGGPAGLTTAIGLASAGVETVLVAGPAREPDHRTTALLASSVTALEMLGVWERCFTDAAPLRVLRLVDATGRLLRAPEVSFDSAEIGLAAFGYNIENRHLLASLAEHAREIGLTQIAEAAQAVEIGSSSATVRLGGGSAIAARLVVAADGRLSLCRAAAGIPTDTRRYPQTALAFNLGHSRPHADTSTEFHTETGPFTLVPLPGRRSSLVCVLDPASADALVGLDDAALSLETERRAHSILGKMQVEGGRGVFPLAIETARTFAARRVALVGEAAHVLPPIGAQGLNLGLRDAATVCEFVIDSRRMGGDVGAADLLARYDAQRRADVTSRTIAVDLLNRSLLTDFLPVQGARGFGLYLLDQLGPLRRAVMREGIAPLASQPRLMRGEAL
jgi:2-octaprenyl-6-methoxyphenol hydroxylase